MSINTDLSRIVYPDALAAAGSGLEPLTPMYPGRKWEGGPHAATQRAVPSADTGHRFEDSTPEKGKTLNAAARS